jgi:valyl-tRNA synthetase
LPLATLSELKVSASRFDSSGGATRSSAQFDLRIAYGDAIDVKAEVARLRKETDRLAKDLESKRTRLADDTFRSRAPAEVVRTLETTMAERQAEYQKLRDRLAQLERAAGSTA